MADKQLYHVILTSFHFKDPNSEVQKVRVCGTFTSIKAAKAAAHRTFFDAGYEQEWFKVFDSQTQEIKDWKHGDGVIVYAEAPDGEVFTISVYTAKDTLGLQGNNEGKVEVDLYHIPQTTIFYGKDARGDLRETKIEGTFQTNNDARAAAMAVLVDKKDGLTKESWAEYDELPLGQKDWEFGENVLVHAVGSNGENVLLTVVKEQEMESFSIMEAAMRIRAWVLDTCQTTCTCLVPQAPQKAAKPTQTSQNPWQAISSDNAPPST